MIKISKFKIILMLSTVCFLFSGPVFAAEISFGTKTNKILVGQQFEVNVFINTDAESINAIEGKITFPQELLQVKKINDGNSIINFWVEKPKIESGDVSLSGIVPGGYDSNRGLIVSITFLAKNNGTGVIGFSGVKVLRNDGAGTEANTQISNLQFSISNPPPGESISPIPAQEVKDNELPEAFMPQIARDPAIFNGQWFLVFAAQDKGSGIDHYEVSEGNQPFAVAESPYLLQNQNLSKKITVRAIDKSGNERTVTIPAQRPSVWYKNYLILAIIILAIMIAYLIYKVLWRKRKK